MENNEQYLKISPNYDVRKLIKPTLEDYIDIFEDRVQGWIIDSAHILDKHEHAGLSVLQVTVAYFELIAMFLRGEDSNNQSRKFFKYGFLAVFPEVPELFPENVTNAYLELVYQELRCGLYHTGLPRGKIWLVDHHQPISIVLKPFSKDTELEIDKVIIDTTKFIVRIQDHFQNYIYQIRNHNETVLRNNFWKSFSRMY